MSPTSVTFDEAYFRDPHDFYRKVQNEGPIHRFETPSGVHGWLITGGDDLQVVLLSILNRLDPDLRTTYRAGSRAAALPPHNGFLCEDR